MSINTEVKERYALVKIDVERLDSTVSPEIKTEFVSLSKSGVKNIVVDLLNVKYCDSSGLSALLVGNRLCNEINGKFVINSLQEMVQKLIEISQLDKVLNISNSIEEADKILA